MLLQSIIRKSCQLAHDPTLRSWLFGRVFGRWPGEAAFKAHHPPYLDGLLPLADEQPTASFRALSAESPTQPITLVLAGQDVEVAPGQEEAVFARSFDDVETLLSLHRFAWLTASEVIDPAWVQALWKAWRKSFGTPSDHLAWHPYTASERASNILTFARGLPGPLDDTVRVLAAHAPQIASRLEYFGDHHTSNHLANNGRGLYLLGCLLGMEKTAAMGLRILLEEAQRIILASGMLREGSSHYHFLVLRLYEKAAAIAVTCGRPEADELNEICAKLRAVAGALMLPGGLPLIGDISPDITPKRLLGDYIASSTDSIAADGWLRFDSGPWSGLWHAAPEGLSHMPGHGHQDMGSFELHYQDEPLCVDAGRGAYGETGEAAFYRSSHVHNGLGVDGRDPYPPNRPYYDEKFRSHIAGRRPEMTTTASSVSLRYPYHSIGDHTRQWDFADDHLTIKDVLSGTGKHDIVRRLVSPLEAEISDGAAILRGREKSYRVRCSGADLSIKPVTCWRAYGQGNPGTMITFSTCQDLPFQGVLNVEVF
jgi:hypothetical protein